MKKVTNLENKIIIKLIIIAISLIGLTILMFVAKKGIETLSPYIYAVIVAISVIAGLYYVKSLMPFKKENQIKKCYETCDYLVIFTVSCLVIQFIFITIVFSAKVDGSSMFPNLNPSYHSFTFFFSELYPYASNASNTSFSVNPKQSAYWSDEMVTILILLRSENSDSRLTLVIPVNSAF